MAYRSMSSYRRAWYGLACALALTLAACSGGGGATGPDDVPPSPNPGPAPAPLPAPDPGPAPNPVPAPAPGPVPDPGPPQPVPSTGIAGTYGLMQINNSQPGQMVTVSNPDGKVIGLYRFDAVTRLTLDPLQTFDLQLRYRDDKGEYGIDDQGEFKQVGSTGGVLALTFASAIYDDVFPAIAVDGVVSIKYDFDGDGQVDTVFGFERIGD